MPRFLTTYMNNRRVCPNGAFKVNIAKEIEFKRSKLGKSNARPLIVFDCMSCISMFVGHPWEVLCGGRQAECTKRAELFFGKLKELDVEMVFFWDGPIKPDKLPAWARRANSRYEAQQDIFNAVRRTGKPDLNAARRVLSAYHGNIARVVKKYGKVFISLHNECDLDIAEYASAHQATLAVFADDSDYLIMPGNWNIWLPSRTNIEDLTTVSWNKGALRSSLNLKQNQMAIFATLSGNDFLDFEVVKHFFDRFIAKRGMYQKRLSEFIRRHYPNGEPLNEKQFNSLIDFIYDKGKCGIEASQVAEKVATSLNFYNYSRIIKREIEPGWLKNHLLETSSTFVCVIYTGLDYCISQSYIDLSNKEFNLLCNLVVPLLQRQVGLVFHEKRNGPPVTHAVYYKKSHEEPYDKHIIQAEFPDFEVPGLEKLYSMVSKECDQLFEKKCEILAWIASSKGERFDFSSAQNLIDTIYFVPVLALNYLVKQLQITIDEADVVLLSIEKSYMIAPEKAIDLAGPEKLEERPFWLSFVFTKLVNYFNNSCSVAGLHYLIKSEYFDGYIFHKMYGKFLSLSREEQENLITNVKKFRLYAN